ncbi:MAG TPA: hypothetical protein VJU79_02280 [Candidatus Dormibacteraeota bacterium]|nr:hypothetical protein [Candidatus Dormibacteraeota bacterium]
MSVSAPLRLRPLEIGDLLDETFRLYRRHFLLFAGISVILAVPSAALYALALGVLTSGLANTTEPTDLTGAYTFLAGIGAALLVNLVVLPFTSSAVTYAACESAVGRPVTAGGVLAGVLRRYFPLLGYWLLFNGVTAGIALVLCIAPFILWIWIYVMWIAATPAMFVENIGLGAAVARSRFLVEGRWWRTFLILFLMAIVTYFARLGLEAFLNVVSTLLEIVINRFLVAAIAQGAAILVAALVTPVSQILVVLIYFDLRVRREALDLFQAAYRLSAPPEPA